MHVANCTEEDVDYTVDDGGDPFEIDSGKYHHQPQLDTGRIVTFFERGKTLELARSVKLPQPDVLVTLSKFGGIYAVGVVKTA